MLNVRGGLYISFDSYDEHDKYFSGMPPQHRGTVMQSRARGGRREILGEIWEKK